MKKFIWMAAAAAVIGASSCTESDEMKSVQEGQRVPMEINNVGVVTMTRSGITANKFTGSEQIGVFIYRNTGIDDASRNYNDAGGQSTENVAYKLGTPWTAVTNPIVLSGIKGKVYSYYPYSATATDPKAVAVSVASDQGTGITTGAADAAEQKDYMYGDVANDICNSNPKIATLNMNHALAMMTFMFKNATNPTESYPGDGMVTQIVVKNKSGKQAVKTGDATMNIATGAITGGTAGDITLAPGVILKDKSLSNEIPHLLLYPNTGVVADDAEISVTMDGKTYTRTIPALAQGWEKGKNYIYTFTLKGTNFEITDVTITQWIPVDQDGGNIDNPDGV